MDINIVPVVTPESSGNVFIVRVNGRQVGMVERARPGKQWEGYIGFGDLVSFCGYFSGKTGKVDAINYIVKNT